LTDAKYDNQNYRSVWADQVFQFCFFKRVFGIGSSDFTSFSFRHGYQDLHLRGSVESRPHYLRVGNSKERPWTQYWFDPHTPQNLFYRLDWLDGMWSVSLRSYIHEDEGSPAREEQERRIASVAQVFRGFADKCGVLLRQYAPRMDANETTRVLVDPCQGPQFLAMGEAHREFVKTLE
jgi:hypothetical protein